MINMGLRHRDSLNGKLSNTRLPARVTLVLSDEVARKPVAQYLTWMLVNLLIRQTPEISELVLLIPENIKPISRLSPLLSNIRLSASNS